MSLKEEILKAENRSQVVNESASIVDNAVKSIGGFSGIAVSGAYKTIKAIKKGFVESVIDGLLPEWAEQLEVFEKEYADSAKEITFSAFLIEEKQRVAEALVEVTDLRAKNTKYKTVSKVYRRLRPSALEYVTANVEPLAEMLEKYHS